MREIEFRGICIDEKTINTDKMVFGYLVEINEQPFILEVLGEDSFIWNKVDPKTVGQYTGKKDKDGKKIYGGDEIIDNNGKGIVEYMNNSCAFRVNYQNGQIKWFIDYLKSELETIEIIGNVHDNPNWEVE